MISRSLCRASFFTESMPSDCSARRAGALRPSMKKSAFAFSASQAGQVGQSLLLI